MKVCRTEVSPGSDSQLVYFLWAPTSNITACPPHSELLILRCACISLVLINMLQRGSILVEFLSVSEDKRVAVLQMCGSPWRYILERKWQLVITLHFWILQHGTTDSSPPTQRVCVCNANSDHSNTRSHHISFIFGTTNTRRAASPSVRSSAGACGVTGSWCVRTWKCDQC